MSKVQSPKSGNVITFEHATGRQGSKSELREVKPRELRVSDLRKSFVSPTGARIEVLRSISFIAEPGETIAIRGASGAGKSTLLHLLGGIESPDHGSIRFAEFEVSELSEARLAPFRNENVGFVFQFHHLLTDLTAAENVAMPLMIAGVPQRKAMSEALSSLQNFGLTDRASHSVASLSGGEQQRVAVCRALVNRPKLVLADEPTGNLDENIGDQIVHELANYARTEQAIVIVVTHNPEIASRCDRSLILREGCLHPGAG